MTAPIKEAHLCAFCGTGVTHIIGTYANDRFAKKVRTTQGEMWKCGNCIEREHDDFIVKQAPDSPWARNILAKRRREIEDGKKYLNSLMKFHKLSVEDVKW